MSAKSQREDGRGHWQRGRSRSTLTAAERALVIRRLRKLAETESARGIAKTLGVSNSAVSRILSGEDQPSARMLRLVRARLP